MHIPAKVAATTGTHLTTHTLFTHTGHVAAGMTVHKVSTAVKLKSAAVTTTDKICEALQ
jgi:5-hydroxyisourate hydrolase-like protein (transthyretin family)